MRVLLEAGGYALALGAFACAPPVRRYLAAIPRPHQLLLAGFFALLTAGQVINRPRATFPFTSWAMYGRTERPETLVVYRCRGVAPDGASIDLKPEELFRSAGKSGIASMLKHLVRVSSLGAAPSRDEADRRLDAFLRSTARAHQRAHPGTWVATVQLIEWSLDLAAAGSAPRERLLRALPLEGEQP